MDVRVINIKNEFLNNFQILKNTKNHKNYQINQLKVVFSILKLF